MEIHVSRDRTTGKAAKLVSPPTVSELILVHYPGRCQTHAHNTPPSRAGEPRRPEWGKPHSRSRIHEVAR